MIRSSRNLGGLCLVFGLFLAPAGELRGGEQDPPNILVFLADDVDAKDYGCYGNDSIRTPNIDALAASGLRCDNAFLTTSQCSPTRISVLTGKYPHATGAEDLHTPLPKDQTFVSTYLKDRDYFCGHMLKTHYGPNGNDQFDWYSKNLDDFPEFIEATEQRPFFMWVGFRDAHRPYQKGAVSPPHDPAEVEVPPYLVDDQATREDLALYYDEISRMDEAIGRMMEQLKERGLTENTLVVFFGDNGRPFPRCKGTLYDSGIGTPLVCSWPKVIEAGSVYDGLVSVVDLAPTFLDIAGVKVPSDMQGHSIAGLFRDTEVEPREYVFAERNWHNCDEHMRSVRSNQYKLIRNAYLDLPHGTPSDLCASPSWQSLKALLEKEELTDAQAWLFQVPRPEYELYDVINDPQELNNLAEDDGYSSVREQLAGVLEEWRERTGDFPPTKRRRPDNVNRSTGVKFQQKVPEMLPDE